MDTSSRKTSLVVLFNHQYERNIPVIRELYSRRFSGLLQLMPYYKGDAPDVCSVFGNSFQFYNYILQSRERIRQLEGDYFLIIGDDLLLNFQRRPCWESMGRIRVTLTVLWTFLCRCVTGERRKPTIFP